MTHLTIKHNHKTLLSLPITKFLMPSWQPMFSKLTRHKESRRRKKLKYQSLRRATFSRWTIFPNTRKLLKRMKRSEHSLLKLLTPLTTITKSTRITWKARVSPRYPVLSSKFEAREVLRPKTLMRSISFISDLSWLCSCLWSNPMQLSISFMMHASSKVEGIQDFTQDSLGLSILQL